MKEKFTSSKWVALDGAFVYSLNSNGTNQFQLSVENNGTESASLDELQANAHLIAAAPEMYKMLSEMRDTFGNAGMMKAVVAINKLLAKARGEI